MSRSRSAACLVLGVIVASASGCAQTSAPPASPPAPPPAPSGFTNPVWDSNFPDPMIITGPDDTYWAFATNGNGANVQTLTSSDLVTWQPATDALPDLARWTAPGDVWAPEVAVHGPDRFVMYYTTRAPAEPVQCISVAAAESPGGPYVDSTHRPLVCEEDQGGSIDAHPFVTVDGERFLYWKNDGNRIGVDTWISVQRLDETGTRLVGKPQRLFSTDQPWEGRLVEAPFVWQLGNRFLLFYSANAYDSGDYAVGVATADAPTGPFTKQPEPILVSNDVAAGPGHNALVERDGRVWMVYHAWAPDGIGSVIPGRTMWLSEVTVGEDGSVSVTPPTLDYPRRP